MKRSANLATAANACALAFAGAHAPITYRTADERVPCEGREILAGCRHDPHPPHAIGHELNAASAAAPVAHAGPLQAALRAWIVEEDA